MNSYSIILITLLLLGINVGVVQAQSSATNANSNANNRNITTTPGAMDQGTTNKRAVKTLPITSRVKEQPGMKADNKKSRAMISNAAVTAINGTSLTVTKDGKTYAITTNAQTKFRRHYGGQATIAEFAVGNFIDISGQWTDTTQSAITAKSIRNRSIMKLRGSFIGEVVSKTGTSIVIATKNKGNQTITVSATTKYVNRSQLPITLADVVVGHRIRVRGLWDKSTNTITQATQIKDFSLPTATSVTPGITNAKRPSVSVIPSGTVTPSIQPSTSPVTTEVTP